PDAVQTLEREMRGIFGSRLQSLVVYGERMRAALHAHGGHDRGAHHAEPEASAIHTLAIVDALSGDDLRACAGRVAAWHEAALVLAAHEFERSLDAFPLEFGAIVEDHVVVSGANPFESLAVDAADVRRAIEVQARSHLLHLREGYLETGGRSDAVSVLIVRSA